MSATSPPAPIQGVRCRRCGRVAVPVQGFGCEQCGASGTDLAETALDGRGRVLAAVVVHEHPQPDVPTPAVIASVLLDEGPVLRALLAGPVPADGWAGRTVTATAGESAPVVFVATGDPA
ncbi:Zn-ribbon domain-containing OB-fold protein [Pseudonocardia sichuanensis]